MTVQPVPPLPDPVEPGQQTPEHRRAISRRFIIQARNELTQSNRLQAGEKAWGAIAQLFKIVGQERGWQHHSHRQLESIGHHVRAEYPDLDSTAVADTLWGAYHIGHINFYENQYDLDEIEALVDAVERQLPALERLATEASLHPRPFEIESIGQRRRLREITGNHSLDIGDKSGVGFSLLHSSVSDGDTPG